ncbi:DNA-binding transcriptional regulator, MarR family [Saccharopolyspora kobensis]|uniref:DNA-binding transcriptional regulator, MarR family n=2 Tax=Saccharopolyspora kobensis TaxID=146035 RepID=A0A1H6EIH9_9PSEU|nr:DNA-binding transcriptional regulator, MarR family [Saccharopolyspora kobensis]SFF05132.1 DNA-binding transcriptional regulator, MarR family [Saccharopolyspora kobensis]
MIDRMPDTREQLIADIGRAVSEFQDATDEVDEAGAARLGVNRTDLRCLNALNRHGALTAGALATAVGLSTGATTIAVDRLVRQGYVERVRADQDRRRITITITPAATALIEELWGPIEEESHELLRRRSQAELKAIREFLREGAEFQTDHAARIRRET